MQVHNNPFFEGNDWYTRKTRNWYGCQLRAPHVHNAHECTREETVLWQSFLACSYVGFKVWYLPLMASRNTSGFKVQYLPLMARYTSATCTSGCERSTRVMWAGSWSELIHCAPQATYATHCTAQATYATPSLAFMIPTSRVEQVPCLFYAPTSLVSSKSASRTHLSLPV